MSKGFPDAGRRRAEHGSGGVGEWGSEAKAGRTAIHSPNGVREDSPGERPNAVE